MPQLVVNLLYLLVDLSLKLPAEVFSFGEGIVQFLDCFAEVLDSFRKNPCDLVAGIRRRQPALKVSVRGRLGALDCDE